MSSVLGVCYMYTTNKQCHSEILKIMVYIVTDCWVLGIKYFHTNTTTSASLHRVSFCHSTPSATLSGTFQSCVVAAKSQLVLLRLFGV